MALGLLLAGPTAAELMLTAVREEPLLAVALPAEVNWSASEKLARTMVVHTRDSMAPRARIAVESDALIWRALCRVVRREHRDLLVVGSAHDAEDGHVRLGRSARQLFDHLECPLAVAPRGLAGRTTARLRRIGVGFDGGPESQAALALATSIAAAAESELEVWGAVDDSVAPGLRVPPVERKALNERQLESALARDLDSAKDEGIATKIAVTVGMPTDVLSDLGERVDLLVIGSAHSGRTGRLQLGATGRALLRYAACPMLVVPRPPD